MSVSPPPLADRLGADFEAVETIASRDLNNLYLTSRFFEDRERYAAFCSLYALMRVIDDRVDEIPDRDALDDDARRAEHAAIDAWSDAFLGAVGPSTAATAPAPVDDPRAPAILRSAVEAMRLFPLPLRIWRNFFHAMHVDVDQSRFATWDEFLRYTEGASVAPTTIYLDLIVAEREDDGIYRPPRDFDLVAAGRHLGTFAYIGHILRDFAEDLETGTRGLVYLAREDLAAHALDERALRAAVERGEASDPLRALARELADRADVHLRTGRSLLAPLDLPGDRAYVLELIVTIYERVLEKIAVVDHDIAGTRHRLTMDEKQAIAADVGERVGFGAA